MTDCPTCNGTGFVVGEQRGYDADGEPLFVQWACDCRVRKAMADTLRENAELYRRLAKHEAEERHGDR